MKKIFLFFLIIFCIFGAIGQESNLTIKVEGIKDIKGAVQIGIYNERNMFLSDTVYAGVIVPVKSEEIIHTFENLGNGQYALAIFHDKNRNKKLDTNFLGIPVEGYGFSNNVFGIMGSAPGYSDASIFLKSDMEITIKLRY